MHIRRFTIQIANNDYVHLLIEDVNHSIWNKENYYDIVFHQYNLHKVHVNIEFPHRIMHLIKSINIFFYFSSPINQNLQANKAKTDAPDSSQKL